MKLLKYFMILFLGATLLSNETSTRLDIGQVAPLQEMELPAVTGGKASLKSLQKENGLVVVFSCNTCPFVLGWESKYNYINDIGQREGVDCG